jgi:hypothetical protein
MSLALSFQEPYAWLVLQLYDLMNDRVPLKPIENRDWPLPKAFKVPQRIWVHASMGLYQVMPSEIAALMNTEQRIRCVHTTNAMVALYYLYRNNKPKLQETGYFGCLLGTIVITGQVTQSDNPWFLGKYGFTLEYPRMLDKPIPYKGQLNFFEVDIPDPDEEDLSWLEKQ